MKRGFEKRKGVKRPNKNNKGNNFKKTMISFPPRSFPGQLQTQETIIGASHQFISAGASPYSAALSLALQPNADVPSWADFVDKYQLYRVVAYIAEYNDYLTYAGYGYWWFSENAAGSTLAIAQQQHAKQVNLHRVELLNKIKYLATQLDLLSFVATNASIVNPPNLNMYSDNTINNTTASTQLLGILTVRYVVQFMGSQ